MRTFKYVLGLAIVMMVLYFAFENMQEIRIHTFGKDRNLPAFYLLIISFGAGIAVSSLFWLYFRYREKRNEDEYWE